MERKTQLEDKILDKNGTHIGNINATIDRGMQNININLYMFDKQLSINNQESLRETIENFCKELSEEAILYGWECFKGIFNNNKKQ